jgi:hypothetical protein
MDSLVYNCQDIVRIRADGLTRSLRKKLGHGLGHFEVKMPEDKDPDVLIRPMEKAPELPVFSRHLNHIFGFTTVDYGGTTAVACLHKGIPEFCLFFSSPAQLSLLFRPVSGQENRFYGLVLFGLHLMVRKKGMLMAHAAAVVRNGRAVVISGHHGMGKTPVLLSLLRAGWQSLGDDKVFVTHEGLAMVEPYLAVSQYHFSLLPWLYGFLHQRPASRLPETVRTVLDRVAGRVWPGGTPVKAYRFLNPGMKIDLRQLPVPDLLADHARPVHWIILRPGSCPKETQLTRDQGIGMLTNIQDMFFSHRLTLEKSICLHSGTRVTDSGKILESLLPDITFSLISCSGKMDIPRICERVAAHAQ